MKKISFTFLIIVISATSIFSQALGTFKYQTMVRDNTGDIIANQPVSIRIDIIRDSINGASIYSEIHSVATNQFEMLVIDIGRGTVETGIFEDIKWGETAHFLKLELDGTGGTNYQFMGVSELLSVPYSLNSGSVTLTSPNVTNYNVSVDDSGVLAAIRICPPNITDFDGNTYKIIEIGLQCWMAENLKTTKYRNGDNITYPGNNNTTWASNTTGAYAWYDNDISWKNLYGALYNWHAVVNSKGLCPIGWHVPSQDELVILTNFIGGTSHGNELKSCRQDNSPLGGDCNTIEHPRWDEDPSSYGTDNYGFAGLPGGGRFFDGSFLPIGYACTCTSTEWNALESIGFNLFHYGGIIAPWQDDKRSGAGVRCLKD